MERYSPHPPFAVAQFSCRDSQRVSLTAQDPGSPMLYIKFFALSVFQRFGEGGIEKRGIFIKSSEIDFHIRDTYLRRVCAPFLGCTKRITSKFAQRPLRERPLLGIFDT